MTTLIYASIAIVFLLLILGLRHKPQSQDPEEALSVKVSAPSINNGRWLDLSERIFDPSDACWLEEELAFPKLAKALTLGRQQLAIRWLESLQASFNEVVRTPELVLNDTSTQMSPGSWRMLWLTVRFKVFVSYALLVVKLFGPYHRLMPSFSWVALSTSSEHNLDRRALAQNRISH
jgi:hypothetical protein